MLTSDEIDRIRALARSLSGAPDGDDARLVTFMAGLPGRAEALDLARAELLKARPPLALELDRVVARMRELLSVAPAETKGQPRSSLEMLLAGTGPHAAKVDALLAVVRATDRTAVPVIKARLPAEPDPFVLATLASALGHLGDKTDAGLLLPLLDSRDARVVANALDALNRMEAEAPVAQVRELVHAADHRLRLSALALLARTDPVTTMLVLPPLIAEKHPTLTGGIALLLGDLAAQPLATDLLLELFGAEDRPQILKHVAESLKRHADTAPERLPEMVRRLTEARAMARPHKVPALTGILAELGITGLPPVAEPDVLPPRKPASGAVPVTAPAVAAPAELPPARPAAAVAPTRTPSRPAADGLASKPTRVPSHPAAAAGDAYQSGLWKKGSGSITRPPNLALAPEEPAAAAGDAYRSGLWKKGSGSITRPPNLALAPEEPAAAAGAPWMWLGGAACVLVGIFALGSGSGSAPALTSVPAGASASVPRSAMLRGGSPRAGAPGLPAAVRSAPATRAAATGEGPLGRPPPKTLGATGVELTVEGEVVAVATHRVVVKAGHVFYTLRGKGLTGVKVGDVIKRRGKLAGVARDGMVFVTVGSA